jgi:hypothetical protein
LELGNIFLLRLSGKFYYALLLHPPQVLVTDW